MIDRAGGRIDFSRFAVLAICLCFFATNVFGEFDTAEFEEDFDIIRYHQSPEAHDFNAFDLERNSYRLSDFKNRFVMVNFWATWCLPCIRELPQLDKLRQAIPEAEFQILAINVRDRESRLRKFLATRPYGFKIPLDRTGEIYKMYGVVSFPTTFLIDPRGKLFGKIIGARDWVEEDFITYMKHLIKKGARDE